LSEPEIKFENIPEGTPCPTCGNTRSLVSAGGSYTTQISCMACGKSWTIKLFKQKLKNSKFKPRRHREMPHKEIKRTSNDQRFCPNCGKHVETTYIFCTYCGAKLQPKLIGSKQ